MKMTHDTFLVILYEIKYTYRTNIFSVFFFENSSNFGDRYYDNKYVRIKPTTEQFKGSFEVV